MAAVVAGLFAVLIAGFSSSASAAGYAPYPPTTADCTISTTTAHAGPGSSVTLVGSGFGPNVSVALSVPSASAALGSVTTSKTGTFSSTFTWPASVSGASAVVEAAAPSDTCSFTLVNAKSSLATHNESGSSGLSSTGFETLTATTIALALIGGGAIFLGLARRKRV